MMKTKQTNFFVREYEPIRQTLLTIYSYGCYDAYQISNRLQMIGYKFSSRTYDEMIKRVKYFWPDVLKSDRKINLKKIHYFPFDRYKIDENYLWRSYELKTFNEQDINLYFFILQALSENQTLERGIAIDEIIAYIEDAIFKTDDDNNENHAHMIRNKLTEMINDNFVVSYEDKYKFYRLADNMLDHINEEALLIIYYSLFLYRDILPLSSIGYSLQKIISMYLKFSCGNENVSDTNIFIHKDIFFQNILNDEVIFKILTAIEKNKNLCFLNYFTQVNSFKPYHFIFDRQYGRQYVWGFCGDKETIYRLDRISKIIFIESDNNIEHNYRLINNVWTASIPENIDSKLVEIDFCFNDSIKEAWLIRKLYYQKREGKIDKLSPTHYLYTIYVRDPYEMIPWIRSWGSYAHVRNSKLHELNQRLEENWQQMQAYYKLEQVSSNKKAFNINVQIFKTNKITQNKADNKHKNKLVNETSIFKEYRNLYYSAIQCIYYLMILNGENFTKKDLIKFIQEFSHVDKKNQDKFLKDITKFGERLDKLSLFKQDDDGILRPSEFETDNEISLPPIMLNYQEKRYLKTLLEQEGMKLLLGEDITKKILNLLQGINSFNWNKYILNRGIYIYGELHDTKLLWDNMKIIMNAIRKKSCLSYNNFTNNGIISGICKPYKIMYSSKTCQYQLVAIAKQNDKENSATRLILMNINKLHDLKLTDDSYLRSQLPEKFLQQKRMKQPIKVKIFPIHGHNDIERAFLLFSSYEKKGWYNSETGIYHLEIIGYDFEMNEIIEKILSLGSAIEVIEPKNLREHIIKIVNDSLQKFSHNF